MRIQNKMNTLAGSSDDPNAVEIIECGCCSCYHRVAYHGDCRNDAERFADPEDAEARLGKPTREVFEEKENWLPTATLFPMAGGDKPSNL